ncbi:MAG TPA: polyprenyl diphosphate synthase [Candidatus Saccharimonadales bacterium]
MAETTTAPKHLGLILDGNRRWAREHNLTIMEGHRAGYASLKSIAKSALRHGVSYVSAYVFSTENRKRNKEEVRDLMRLLMWVLKHEIKELHREGIRVRIIGSKLELGHAMLRAIHNAEDLTKDNDRGTLLLCLDYGGQQEIVEATKRIVEAGYEPDVITPELLSQYLYAPDVPPLDLVIRTSGEQRLSNFMLWESAYSELLFTKVYWPDFDEKELLKAFKKYGQRQRRYGK